MKTKRRNTYHYGITLKEEHTETLHTLTEIDMNRADWYRISAYCKEERTSLQTYSRRSYSLKQQHTKATYFQELKTWFVFFTVVL